MIDGRARIRSAIAELLPAQLATIPIALTDLFERDLGGYTELILGPGGRPIGFMTHGEGVEFTERVRVALEQLDLPAEARAHHQSLARWFEHKRGFFKVEWHLGDDGSERVEPLAAIYFRRRPPLNDVVERMGAWGLSDDARAHTRDFAATLAKNDVHFVSAAFRPGRPIHHKLYFSQWVAADTRADVAARIERLHDRYAIAAELRAAWAANHHATLGIDDQTLFVSMSCSAAGVSPSFKLDYPDIQPEIAARWAAPAQKEATAADVQRVKELAGARQLAFMGVRFASDATAPTLKYYGDVPGSR